MVECDECKHPLANGKVCKRCHPSVQKEKQKQASPKREQKESPLFKAYQQLVNDAKDADQILERLKKTHPKKARNFEASAHENAHARVEGAIRDISQRTGIDEVKLKSLAAIKRALAMIELFPGDETDLRSDFEYQHEYYEEQVIDFMGMHNIPMVHESSIKQMPMLPPL